MSGGQVIGTRCYCGQPLTWFDETGELLCMNDDCTIEDPEEHEANLLALDEDDDAARRGS